MACAGELGDLPRVRMRLAVHVQHPASRNPRVNNGRPKVLVSEQNCDRPSDVVQRHRSPEAAVDEAAELDLLAP